MNRAVSRLDRGRRSWGVPKEAIYTSGFLMRKIRFDKREN